MHINDDGTRTFSHTSLSLWRLCKRRWCYRYIQHVKERVSIPASWSVHMVHKPFERYVNNEILDDAAWEAYFKAFCDEIGGDPEDGLHTVGTGKRIFEAIRACPPQLSDLRAECEGRVPITATSGMSTRPDLVGTTTEGRRVTVDFKYTETKWRSASSPWPVKPLLPYDDQLIGQAILSKADSFSRATIRINPANGKLADVIWEERLLDDAARQEWLSEMRSTIGEIESWLLRIDPKWNLQPDKPWPKNEDACYAYGKPCPAMALCKAGWKLTSGKIPKVGIKPE